MENKALIKSFVEEAEEKILEIEDGLLNLDVAPQHHHAEIINTIFRAAHTVKGLSASLNFDEITDFTHAMEELMDVMRKGVLDVTRELVNNLFEANDLLKDMIDNVARDAPFDFSRCGTTKKKMRLIKENATSREFRVIFTHDPALLNSDKDPSKLIERLKKIGAVIGVNTDAVPMPTETNPDRQFLKWDVLIKTGQNEDAIKAVLLTSLTEDDFKILTVESSEKKAPMLGQLLVNEGLITTEDLAKALESQKVSKKRLGDILIESKAVSPEDIRKVLEKQTTDKIQSFASSITSTIRVDLTKLDTLLNLVGEMLIMHSMLQQELGIVLQGRSDSVDTIFSQILRVGKEIQESTMALRMLPVGTIFNKYIRVVKDVAESNKKQIQLRLSGKETELDKGVLEKISDPLIHLIRNAIDHGIESPEERQGKGKPPEGMINLGAFQIGDAVYIEVQDDGKGIDKDAVLEKALENRVIFDAHSLTDEDVYDLIFVPGFSTALQVNELSGRGVGMDVVKKNIDALNGKIFIRSEKDKGTTFTVKLPLTLAIIDGLTVSIGEEVFVIPLTSVVETLRPLKEEVTTISEKGEVVKIRDRYVPLIRLHEVMKIKARKTDPSEAIVIVTRSEDKTKCLLVDDIIGQQQIVVKKLGNALPRIPDVAGGTILGDGKIALVLDIPGIIELSETGETQS